MDSSLIDHNVLYWDRCSGIMALYEPLKVAEQTHKYQGDPFSITVYTWQDYPSQFCKYVAY